MLASGLADPRDRSKIQHSLEGIIRFRMMIGAGYEDGNDAADLRHDPSFKIALERNPEAGAALCSQPTISRMRRFNTFAHAAGSWSKARHVVARVDVSSRGRDTRDIVTNLDGGRGKTLYEKIHSARGQAENHIKGWKTHLASDRTSCTKAPVNQMRLMLHRCAYWI